MKSFVFNTPTKVVFGLGTEAQAGSLAAECGAKKVLLHYGGKSAERSGLLDRVRASLKEASVDYVELGGVVPNPLLSKVYEGIALAKAEGVDFILAVGGGSVIDSSKAIAYGMGAPEEDVWDYFCGKRKAEKALPVGAVLTIAAAGSEMSKSCVITNDETKEKRGYGNEISRPRFAVMDPELTCTLPDWQTMSGCTDIMMHTMERYFTAGEHMELTDEISEGLLRTVRKNAEILHAQPADVEARAEVMWASSLSHNCLTECGAKPGGDFATHKMEHELGGLFDVTHGAGLAALWGSWARYVMKNVLPRFVKYAERVMGVEKKGSDEETAIAGIEATEAFFRSIGMPTSIRGLGVEPTEEQIDWMAASCARGANGSLGSAMVLHEEDIKKIYQMAR